MIYRLSTLSTTDNNSRMSKQLQQDLQDCRFNSKHVLTCFPMSLSYSRKCSVLLQDSFIQHENEQEEESGRRTGPDGVFHVPLALDQHNSPCLPDVPSSREAQGQCEQLELKLTDPHHMRHRAKLIHMKLN
jgi:hypothetical protein